MKKYLLSFLVGIFSTYLFCLEAADSTSGAVSIPETWQTISNRWGSIPIEKIKQAAETNEVTAQYYLASAYSGGNGVSKDEAEAYKWMNLAAEQGMAGAQRKLGWMLQNGLGVETNVDEAVGWYQKAAEQGDAQAQFNLGWMHEKGVNVSQDYAEAAKFYRLAAEQGHAMAQNNLGWLYKNELGAPDNQLEALKWFQKSAEQGEPLAQKNLARIYAAGEYGKTNRFGQGADAQIRSGGVAPNHELAEKWMRRAVDLNSAEGQYQFGNLLYGEFDNEGHQDTTRFSDAAEWFRKAAEQGYAKAQYQLAQMYNTGELGEEQRSNCIPWFLKAAEQGNADAQAEVGQLSALYPNNEQLKPVNNIEMLHKAAESGNLKAQYELARRYQLGVGVPKDPVEAFKWMQRAANNDTMSSWIGDAIYYLALMYEKGEGVTQDILEAHKLFLEAAGPAFQQPDASFRVGQMYEKGDGVPQDDHEAAEFYSNIYHFPEHPGYEDYQTPGNGSVEALFQLWAQGRGFPNDKDKTQIGYREPANLIKTWDGFINTAKAELYLGEMYYQGKLVTQDLVEASARVQVAANQNLDEARQMLNQIQLEMSSTQKEAAKGRYDLLEKRFERAKEAKAISEMAKQNFPELFLD